MQIAIEPIKQYFLDRADVAAVYLFGSFAKNKQNKHSDLDIAVLFNPNIEDNSFTDRQIAVVNELSEITKRDVDAVVLNRAVPLLKFQVIKYGKKIYDTREIFDRRFEAHSIIEYFDFLPVRNFLENSMVKKIKEGF